MGQRKIYALFFEAGILALCFNRMACRHFPIVFGIGSMTPTFPGHWKGVIRELSVG